MHYEGYEKALFCDDCGMPLGRIIIGGTNDNELHVRLGIFLKRMVAYCFACQDKH